MAQNIAEFRIIGRIGKLDSKDKVTFVDVASNYNRKDGEEWKTDTHWNRITAFSKIVERADKANVGDLVHITGRVRQSRYEKDGTTNYTVDLIADGFSVLAKATDKGGDEEQD